VLVRSLYAIYVLDISFPIKLFKQQAIESTTMSINRPAPKDEAMMEKCIAEAQTAVASGKVGVAALILWHDNILALSHNMYVETGDMTAHAEMVVLHNATQRLNQMSAEEKAEVTLYTTLEPCLMCLSAISFVGIKRVVYAALAEDANQEELIVRGITAPTVNDRLTRGPLELVPGVLREEGRALLAKMGKLA
jgi:tRNA(adenine34) deaminase